MKKYILILFAALTALCSCADKQSSSDLEQSLRADSSSSSAAAASTTTSAAATTAAAKPTAAATTIPAPKPKPPADLVLKCKPTAEVYSELTLADFITEKNVELRSPDAKLPTSKLGSCEINVSYIYKQNVFSKKLTYTVTDTQPPVIILNGSGASIPVGSKFNINDLVSYGDNCDKNPVLTVTGKVDTSKAGKYTIKACVTDSSGNKTEWEPVISVVEKLPSYPDTTPIIAYSDFIKRDYGKNVRCGIDVSSWQGNIDFKKVKAAGCTFVMIRIGYCSENIVMDEHFKANLKNASDAGLDVGIYIYTADRSPAKAREHAKWVLEQLGGAKLAMPVAFDWEEVSGFQDYDMSLHDLNETYAAFADEIRKGGYTPILYSSPFMLNSMWDEKTKAAGPVWLAHYVDKTDYKGDFAIWQVRGYGRLDGISGNVDLDIHYTDKAFI